MGHIHDVLALGRRGEHVQGDEPSVERILEIVDRIRHVVGPVHHLLLEAGALSWRTFAQPVEDLCVVGVVTELVRLATEIRSASVVDSGGVAAWPGVLARGIERGAREIEPDTATRGGVNDLRLEPRHHAKSLGIALESTDRCGLAVELALAVVAKGRMPEVMGKPRDVDEIRVAPQRRPHLTCDLCDLERVGQARAREVGTAGDEHLRGRCQSTQARGVQHAGAVAREG